MSETFVVPKFQKLTSANNTPLEQKKEYSMNFNEYLVKYGVLVIDHATGGASSSTIPEGYTLFVTSARCDTNVVGIVNVYTNASGNTKYLVYASGVGLGGVVPASCFLSFPIPIKISQGEVIVSNAGAGGMTAGWTGYLISNSYLI